MSFFCPTFILETGKPLNCSPQSSLQGLHWCLWSFNVCSFVSVLFVLLNVTSPSTIALYNPDGRTLASCCADHGKNATFSWITSMKVPFILITSQLVEVAGRASFPSCSYQDSLSSLITRRAKSRVSNRYKRHKAKKCNHIKSSCYATKEFPHIVIRALNHQSLQHNINLNPLYQKPVTFRCKVFSSGPLIIYIWSPLIMLPMLDDNMQ